MMGATRWGTLPLIALVAVTCARASQFAPPEFPFAVDSVSARVVSRGVTHLRFMAPSGPWAVHVLTVDLDRCNRVVAVKGRARAVGRERTSTLLRQLDDTLEVVGGVNADFFLFAPAGVPTGAMISRGQLIAGPIDRPVLAFDRHGNPAITRIALAGTVKVGGRSFPVEGWNRAACSGVAIFDHRWSEQTDTASATLELVVRNGTIAAIDTAVAGITIDRADTIVVARGAAMAAMRLVARVGEPADIRVRLEPSLFTEAVGGRPVLVRDSSIVAGIDSAGGAAFASSRHPRTAVGIGRDGRRLHLIVVDGRQKPYSDGMTLRELANLSLALGARDVINLDGGGSTTMVVADSSGVPSVANRPSDAQGERPVGNAIAVVRSCSLNAGW